MYVPPVIADLNWEQSVYYPPPGFHAQGLFELGNGDECGFYWPIGRESEQPIFCEMYHDTAEIVPIASTFAGLVSLKALDSADEEEDDEEPSPWAEEAQSFAEKFDIPLLPKDSEKSLQTRLIADPESPLALFEAARIAFREGNLPEVERHLTRSLALLPEYTNALELMAALQRRQQKDTEAIRWAIETLASPCCFDGGQDKRLKWLKWLQSLPDAGFPEFADDPLWRNRHRLKLDYGVKTSDDILVYEEAIATYLEQGRGPLAIRLRVRLGERMMQETVSFEARYGYSVARHRELLWDNLIATGLESRLPVLGST